MINEKYKFYRIIKNNITADEDRGTRYITFKIPTLLCHKMSNVLKVKQFRNMDKLIEDYKLEIDRVADMTLKTREFKNVKRYADSYRQKI